MRALRPIVFGLGLLCLLSATAGCPDGSPPLIPLIPLVPLSSGDGTCIDDGDCDMGEICVSGICIPSR